MDNFPHLSMGFELRQSNGIQQDGRGIAFIANLGIEVLRLDAVAFIWKQMGTSCENLPEAHMLIQAFNAVTRIAAPALLFKSEAIVHPDEVTKYISLEECQLSYNPLLMALLWNSLATREVNLLKLALQIDIPFPRLCLGNMYAVMTISVGHSQTTKPPNSHQRLPSSSFPE